MKKCPYCAEEIQDAAIVCRFCGSDIPKIDKVVPTALIPEISTSNKPILKKSKSKKAILIAIGGIMMFCMICIISLWVIGSTPQAKANSTKTANERALSATTTSVHAQTETAAPTSTPLATATPVVDSSVKAIMDGTGLSQQDAEAAFEIIKSVGFERVENLEFFSNLDTLSAYRAFLGYTDYFMIAFDGNAVLRIKFNDISLYDRDAGGVLDLITNYTLTLDEKINFETATQMTIEKILKVPSTAEFQQGAWNVVREKDIVWVQAYVDSENSFGAKIRNIFTAQYSYTSKNLLYLEFAGEVVYGSLQKP